MSGASKDATKTQEEGGMPAGFASQPDGTDAAGLSVMRSIPSAPWLVAVAIAFLGYILALYAYFDTLRAIVVGAIALLIFLCVSVVSRRQAWQMLGSDSAFAVALILAGLLMMTVFTPGTVPDEPYHFNSAYKWSDMLTGQPTSATSIAMRADDIAFQNEVMANNTLNRQAYEATLQGSNLLAIDTSYRQFPVKYGYEISQNPPQLRLPAVLGILIAKLMGLGSVPLFYLGRLFNFAYFVALVIAAIRITPVGKNIMKMVALLPMTLHVAASYSYDAGTIGFVFLFIALWLRAIYKSGVMSRRELVALGVVALLMAPCKYVYALLIPLIFCIPKERFPSKRQALLFLIGVLLLSFMAILLLRVETLMIWSGATAPSDGLSYRGVEAGRFYTLGGLLSRPLASFLLLVRTLIAMSSSYLSMTLGTNLGWFQGNIGAPFIYSCAWLVLLLASFIPSPDDRVVLSVKLRAVLILVCILLLGALLVMFAVSWTFDTENVIQGVQGRYFLPFLPLLGLGLRGRSLVARAPLGDRLMLFMLLVDLAYLVRIATVAVA